MIDLHCHTTASDGSRTPEEFIHDAKAKGIHTVAITDHDTIDGVEPAIKAGKKCGVRVIPGIELTAEFGQGNVHILGYHIDYTNPDLLIALEANKKTRQEKIPKMILALQNAGYDITLEEVLKEGTGIIGKPHIASVLVKKNYETSIKAAIDSGVLADGGITDIKRKKLSPEQCVELITVADGIPVLAHPYQTKLGDNELLGFISGLTQYGLRGLETYYSEHTPEMTKAYQVVASQFGLIETGGSDWHGSIKPHIQLGTGRGDLKVPDHCLTSLDALKAGPDMS